MDQRFFRFSHICSILKNNFSTSFGVEPLFSIKDMQLIEGDLPARAIKLVQEWGRPFAKELQQMWDTKELKKLPPLK